MPCLLTHDVSNTCIGIKFYYFGNFLNLQDGVYCVLDTTPCLKNCANLFLSELRQNMIIFGRKMAKRLQLCEMHSFPISSISCHHTSVLNADVPSCLATQH